MNKKSAAVVKIENALVEFINEGKFPDVTVKELIEKADVGKSTFYRNYHDVYNVFESLVEDFVDRIMNVVDLICNNPELYKTFKIIFDSGIPIPGELPFCLQDEILFRYSLETNDNYVISSFTEKIIEKLKISYIGIGLDEIEAVVCSRFIAGSIIGDCIHNYTQKKTINLNDCIYAIQLSEMFYKKGGNANE